MEESEPNSALLETISSPPRNSSEPNCVSEEPILKSEICRLMTGTSSPAHDEEAPAAMQRAMDAARQRRLTVILPAVSAGTAYPAAARLDGLVFEQ